MALLCAVLLAGCQGHSVAAQPAGSAVTPASGNTATAPASGSATAAAGASGANGPAGSTGDADLNAVDGQLAGLDSEMARATASPSDGD